MLWVEPTAMTINCVCVHRNMLVCVHMKGSEATHTCTSSLSGGGGWVMPTKFFLCLHWQGGDHSSLWECVENREEGGCSGPTCDLVQIYTQLLHGLKRNILRSHLLVMYSFFPSLMNPRCPQNISWSKENRLLIVASNHTYPPPF